ncbi:MAG: efflux RND transporter periplasmic adaptor subunit [Planctomycetaceae bacterium]|nr:efflux RND transporter periplasmic adaptor subunit [Planctomycetaceae bacterium]
MSTANTVIAKLNSALRSRIKYVLIGVVLLVVIFIFIRIRNGNGQDMIQYKTEPAKLGNITVLVTATGTLEPTNEVEVGSEVSGKIKSIEVDYNNKVKIGQVLARLDTSTLEAKVAQSKADLESAKANVLQAKATLKETGSKIEQYKKARELSGNKVPSQLEYDSAEASLERAKADVAIAEAAVSKAQATLSSDETDLAKAVICSPIDGVVLTRKVETGQTVAASFETPVLFTLAEDLTKMELHVNVDEADIGQVKEGQAATFTVDAYPNQIFDAQITQVRYGSSTTDGVVTYETILTVDNNDMMLRPGMTATADIIVSDVEDVIAIPNSALRFEMPETTEKENGSVLSSLLPHPPGSETKQKETEVVSGSSRQIYVMQNGSPVSVSITTGVTNGVLTEVLSGDVAEDTPVIVGTVSKSSK